jgi:hypothetical protein
MAFLNAHDALAANLFFAAEGFDVDPQETGRFDDRDALGNFPSASGGLKNNHCRIVTHAFSSFLILKMTANPGSPPNPVR